MGESSVDTLRMSVEDMNGASDPLPVAYPLPDAPAGVAEDVVLQAAWANFGGALREQYAIAALGML
ncbi:MAG: hypothetical protein Q8R16_01195, partial [bacterium]|nr:hypothetical protein [bacterium]